MARGWFSSASAGVVCVSCAAVHGHAGSSVWGRWHRCGKCGSTYCTTCGDALASAGRFTRSRRCDNAGCNGTTTLID